MSDSISYSAPSPIEEVKAADGGDGWEVSGHAATWDRDLGNDVIVPGAFKAWLGSGQKTRFLYSHRPDQVLGRVLELREDDTGLHVRATISKTQLGQDVHTLLKDRALDSFSIGFITKQHALSKDGETRQLKQLDLPEISIVALPMNPAAVVSAVKADAPAPEPEPDADAEEPEQKAEWTAAYVNDLPDSAFAVVLSGGTKDGDGKTTPRDLRKLPHHNADGSVDMAHLRNAMSREPQTDMSPEMHAKAHAHLMRHASAEGVGNSGKAAEPSTPPLLTDLPLSEHAGILQAELASFVARAQDTLGALAGKERPLTGAKRLTLDELLETFSGLDAVRSDLTTALALAARPPTGTDVRLSLNPLRRRLAQTRQRLEHEGILQTAPTPVAAA